MTPAKTPTFPLCVLASLRDKQILTQRRKAAKNLKVEQYVLTDKVPVKADKPEEITHV